MKAVAAFPKERAVRLIDAEEPELAAPTQVKLKILDVGICGTDKEIASFAYGAPPDGEDHLIMGHESLARIVEAGPQAAGLKVGDLAVLLVRRPCPDPACRACRAGHQDFCETGKFVERGINRRHGYMTESVVEEARYVVKLSKTLRDVGVLIEPLTIAEKALAEAERVQERLPWFKPGIKGEPGLGTRAVVLGAGPVALLGAMLLRLRGYTTAVYSLEPADDPKAELVRGLGAAYFCSRETALKDLAAQAGPIDLVYEATGAAPLAFEALEYLGTNGVFVFTGVPGRKGPISLDADRLMRGLVLQNQLVFGSVNAPRAAFESAAKDLAAFLKAWPLAVPRLITQRHPLSDFEAPLAGRLPGIKHVLHVGD
jgi:glucose 1-dehydrogenase